MSGCPMVRLLIGGVVAGAFYAGMTYPRMAVALGGTVLATELAFFLATTSAAAAPPPAAADGANKMSVLESLLASARRQREQQQGGFGGQLLWVFSSGAPAPVRLLACAAVAAAAGVAYSVVVARPEAVPFWQQIKLPTFSW